MNWVSEVEMDGIVDCRQEDQNNDGGRKGIRKFPDARKEREGRCSLLPTSLSIAEATKRQEVKLSGPLSEVR